MDDLSLKIAHSSTIYPSWSMHLLRLYMYVCMYMCAFMY